ncbi:Uncharacterized protein TCM_009633 [Theobroma cacao]|uniref:Uncharacterized protein n=1 Tax=Theobroma cacao TaxID=3641 RepID=A0A061ECV9_THECC|nr:Uncharacterized protein TCM_009633 [Theobroma cacao]
MLARVAVIKSSQQPSTEDLINKTMLKIKQRKKQKDTKTWSLLDPNAQFNYFNSIFNQANKQKEGSITVEESQG